MNRGRIRIAVIIVSSIVALCVVAVTVTNAVLLPRIGARVASRLGSMCGCPVAFGGLRYVPTRGISLRALDIGWTPNDITDSTPFSFHASLVRVPLTFSFLRAILRSDVELESGLDRADLDLYELPSWMLETIESLGAEGVIPDAVYVEDLSIRYMPADDSVVSVRFDLFALKHVADEGVVTLTGSNDSTYVFRLNARLAYRAGTCTLGLGSPGLPLAELIDLPLVDGGAIGGRIDIASGADGRVEIDGDVELSALDIESSAISAQPVRGINIGYAFKGSLAPQPERAGVFEITRGTFRMGSAKASLLFSIAGLLGRDPSEMELRLSLDLPVTPVARLMAGVPPQIAGPVRTTGMSGSLSWQFSADIPWGSISDTEWNSTARLDDFVVTEIDSTINPYKLNDGFVHRIDNVGPAYTRTVRIPAAKPASMEWMLLHSEHSQRQIEAERAKKAAIRDSRPDVIVHVTGIPYDEPDPAYRYVYVDDMSPWIIRSILTAEDGDFFFYPGVNPVTLIDAIEINLREGEILFGASTISMQLAKILFLDQQRTFDRKLQEVFLVYLMEHHVPVSKERILELYLNLAEFGPGLFGVYDAARYYFDKDPRDLTAGEATWLASILPAPKVFHRYFVPGPLSDEWFPKLIRLYDIMLERGRMSPEEYRRALVEKPVFPAK